MDRNIFFSRIIICFICLISISSVQIKEKPDGTVHQLLPNTAAEVTAITLKTANFERGLVRVVRNPKVEPENFKELK